MPEEKSKRVKAKSKLFFVVTEMDGLMTKHYSGSDKARALRTVEVLLAKTANGEKVFKGDAVSLIQVKACETFVVGDLELRLKAA